MSSREFSEWIAFSSLEPIGDQRADWRIASLTARVVNMFRAKGTTAAKPTDFMPFLKDDDEDDEAEPQTEEEQKRVLTTVAKVLEKQEPGTRK